MLSYALSASLVLAGTELKVEQYDGPTECSEAEKVKMGDQLGMHYTGTIDESSATGEKGARAFSRCAARAERRARATLSTRARACAPPQASSSTHRADAASSTPRLVSGK